jgi:hypothetical protein
MLSRTRAEFVLLLTNDAGLAARMIEVCPATPRRSTSRPQTPTLPRSQVHIQPGAASSPHLRPRSLTPRKYQNPDHYPYLSVPRPPQTRAAHFKRLYRK